MSFGFGVGDIATAIKFVAKAGEAIKKSGGATDDYQSTVKTLISVDKSVTDLEAFLNNNDLDYRDELKVQCLLVKNAIEDFTKKIKKFDLSLKEDTERPKARRILREVQFELSGTVKELKAAIVQPQLILDWLLSFQTLASIVEHARTTTLSMDQLKDQTANSSRLVHSISANLASMDAELRDKIEVLSGTQTSQSIFIQGDIQAIQHQLKDLQEEQSKVTSKSQDDLRICFRELYAFHKTQLELLLKRQTEAFQKIQGSGTLKQSMISILQTVGGGLVGGAIVSASILSPRDPRKFVHSSRGLPVPQMSGVMAPLSQDAAMSGYNGISSIVGNTKPKPESKPLQGVSLVQNDLAKSPEKMPGPKSSSKSTPPAPARKFVALRASPAAASTGDATRLDNSERTREPASPEKTNRNTNTHCWSGPGNNSTKMSSTGWAEQYNSYVYDYAMQRNPSMISDRTKLSKLDADVGSRIGTENTGSTCEYPGCDKSFPRLADAKRHSKIHFPAKTPIFECSSPRCDKVGGQAFYRLDELVVHQRTHVKDVQPKNKVSTQIVDFPDLSSSPKFFDAAVLAHVGSSQDFNSNNRRREFPQSAKSLGCVSKLSKRKDSTGEGHVSKEMNKKK